ncbi:hypothetical protein EYB33_12745 [Lysinibacillus sphaericus]|uniref:hypothetical protein n=1 Tax=Lysinibacillus sphaericus TaxID=1421 RepID=UPI001E4D6A5E|nr:hypothetical protein [Lysinibacillus sphaericus]UDK97112.1 hypothetical protein EYB33_12745 [Lysinibacillus sphaericus]
MNKLFKSIFFLVTILFVTNVSDASAESVENLEGTTVVQEFEVEGNQNATVEFIDPDLVGKSRNELSKIDDSVSPLGVINEVYSYSYYSYGSHSIAAYNVGPISNQKFLVSVARGQTKNISQTVTVSGSVTYEASVEGSLKEVINIGLTGSASGTISYTYSKSESYVGPDAPNTTRDYYGAIQYDLYNTTVKKYDVYKVYNGNVQTGTTTYPGKSTTINNVKKPKAIVTMRDFIN